MQILIIDDEKNIRLSLSNILKDEGHIIFEAPSGEAGLKLLGEQRIDLVFLDVKLPGIDGIEVLQRIKKENPDTDVLMISGNSDIFTAVRAVKLGAYDFMEKPLSLPKIMIAVANIADKRKLYQKYSIGIEQIDVRHEIIGESPEIGKVREIIRRVAETDAKVLITGESGTGKELVAYAIHKLSRRAGSPFVTFNSAAIPRELVESELFGHERGAFTGADQRKLGKLEMAHEGTIFLDEIGDMNLEAQAKILRVIEQGKFERVGGNKTIDIDVRVLAATNRKMEEAIREGRFREDLFYRLNVVPISLPPLRERRGDVAVLLRHYLQHYARELKQVSKNFTPAALRLLEKYPFPGNIRELKNLVERLCILTLGEEISEAEVAPHLNYRDAQPVQDFPFPVGDNYTEARRAFEKFYLTRQLQKYGWNVSRTARELGLQQPNLSRKIKELDIRNPEE